jgi:hypothetical protein
VGNDVFCGPKDMNISRQHEHSPFVLQDLRRILKNKWFINLIVYRQNSYNANDIFFLKRGIHNDVKKNK